MARRTSILLAVLAVLVPPAGAAAEPVWCHPVRRGDTLWAIARRYGARLDTLRSLNGLTGARSLLRPGRLLALPAVARLRQAGFLPPPAPLLARPGDLERENRHADRDRLSRLADEAAVRRFRRAGLLVAVPAATVTYQVVGVRPGRRLARPWTRRFIEQLAAAFHTLFGSRLRVTSLLRTAGEQRALRLVNVNAAPARGPVRSTHLTGAAVDISTRLMSHREQAWTRLVLGRLARRGVLHAVEELRQPHIHVLVLRRYRDYGRALGTPVVIGGC